jgi:hypothetical protein
VDQAETLVGVAQLAVSLAGFASLVSLLGRRDDERSRAAGARRLRAMLEVSLRNAAFAVLPLPFLESAPSETAVWRVASGLYLVAVGAYIVLLRRREGGFPYERWLLRVTLGTLGLTGLASAANVLGLAAERAFSLYLANLLLGLVSAGFTFLSFAAFAFRGDET